MKEDDFCRPKIGIIGYGSVLNPENLKDIFGEKSVELAVPIKIQGFRRIFNQESTWRKAENSQNGVLNIIRNSDFWFNAILKPDVDRDSYIDFRKRESGYRLIEIEKSQIELYTDEESKRIESNDILLIAIGKRKNENTKPIPSYLDLCLEGAKKWGEEFYKDFIQTTEVKRGENLKEYLSLN